MRGSRQIQMSIPPVTPMIKKILIVNLVVWVSLVLVVRGFFAENLFLWLGLVPAKVVLGGWIWQPFTYMFLHSSNLFHILFNSLVLWMFGGELEQRWGARFFLIYYMFCGIGAAVLYTVGMLIYFLVSSNMMPLLMPVVGASGAIFGIMLAYGIVFGDRVIYFMMIFPMKAKFFVMILGLVEVFSLLDGSQSQVANLAHLGGIVSGFIFLVLWTRYQKGKTGGGQKNRGRRLKLVVDNESKDKETKYWH